MNNKRSKITARRRSRKGFALSSRTVVVIFVALAAALAWFWSLPPPCVALNGTADVLSIDVAHLKPGAAQIYCWKAPGRRGIVRFVVARRSDGGLVAVLDACRVCFSNNLGYRISKSGLFCRFCGNHYPIDSLAAGSFSCSPFKLPFQSGSGLLKIKTSELVSKADLFPPSSAAQAGLSSTVSWASGLFGDNRMAMKVPSQP